ncbi:MAG: glutaredoxin domain-containing protein [Actinomycetota bacterium]
MANTPTAIDVYWRPGCGFCMALDRQLNRLGVPMDKHNIWEDQDAAAFVRQHANGNETVPTVHIGSSVLVNPTPNEVLQTMQAEVPDLVPEGVEAPGQGAVGRTMRRLLGG